MRLFGLSAEERFWAHVHIDSNLDACWPWTLNLGTHGYGNFMIRPHQAVRPSRFAWILTFGDIPDELNVCHECDNPPCCNPYHLFSGTQLDNIRDMAAKGRRVDHVGSQHPKAILCEKDIPVIRCRLSVGDRPTDIARDYGIGRSTIYGIKNHQTWKQVP